MYWLIALTVFVGGAVLSWVVLDRKWKQLLGPPPTHLMEIMIKNARLFHPEFPGHPWFMDLKWSVIRHAFVSIVSALIVYLIGDNGFVTWVICPLNFLYAFSVKNRYSNRKELIAKLALERNASLVEIWVKLVNASKVCIVYAFVAAAVLCILSATL